MKNPVYEPLGNRLAYLLAPAVLVVVVFFVIPMIAIAISAFTETAPEGQTLSFATWMKILSDGFYWEVLGRTVRVAMFTTLLALIVGYPAALYIYFSESAWSRVFLVVAISPLFVSVVVRTYGWIVILSPNGALNTVLPGGLPFRILHTEMGILIGLVHIYIPFMLLSLNASLARIDKRLLSAAASLGASGWRGFLDVLVPLSIPGIIAGCTIVLTISMTAFSTPVLLGGSRSKTMPYLIYQQVMLMSDWKMGGALALFLLFTTIVAVFIVIRILRGATNRAVQGL